jgi:hypothetical protein
MFEAHREAEVIPREFWHFRSPGRDHVETPFWSAYSASDVALGRVTVIIETGSPGSGGSRASMALMAPETLGINASCSIAQRADDLLAPRARPSEPAQAGAGAAHEPPIVLKGSALRSTFRMPGADKQVVNLQVLTAMTGFGLDPQQAVELPRSDLERCRASTPTGSMTARTR